MKLLIDISADCCEALELAADLMDEHVRSVRRMSMPDRAAECDYQARLVRGIVTRLRVVQGD